MNWWHVRRSMSDWLELAPEWYLATQRFRHRHRPFMRKRIPSDRTDIVIEGFPRCANSFAVRAFRHANDPEERLWIATHLHSPAAVIVASRLAKPTLVLIRDPDRAVISQAALLVQRKTLPRFYGSVGQLSEAERGSMVQYWTRRYCQYYQRLMPVKQHLVIGRFEEVTSNFSDIIDRFNRKFGTCYRGLQDQAATTEIIFRQGGVHLSPSIERDQIKSWFTDAYFSDRNKRDRLAAQAAYRQFCA